MQCESEEISAFMSVFALQIEFSDVTRCLPAGLRTTLLILFDAWAAVQNLLWPPQQRLLFLWVGLDDDCGVCVPFLVTCPQCFALAVAWHWQWRQKKRHVRFVVCVAKSLELLTGNLATVDLDIFGCHWFVGFARGCGFCWCFFD